MAASWVSTLPFLPCLPIVDSADPNAGIEGNTQRLRVLSINVNSLSGFLWGEIKAFLGGEGLQYDFIFLQETHRTSSSAFQVDKWMAVGSATKRGEGVLTLIHPRYDASLRHQDIIPGRVRVLRVKVCHDKAAIETLNIYQHVWVHTDEPEQNKQRRQNLLDKCTAAINGMAKRDTLILGGGLQLRSTACDNDLVVLNTWRMKDPCTNYTCTGNSQIDFLMVRPPSADQRARQVQKQPAPFGAWKEMTHHALAATSLRVIRHLHLPKTSIQPTLEYSTKDLDNAYRKQDPRIQGLAAQVQRTLGARTTTVEAVNQAVISAVAQIFSAHSTQLAKEVQSAADAYLDAVDAEAQFSKEGLRKVAAKGSALLLAAEGWQEAMRAVKRTYVARHGDHFEELHGTHNHKDQSRTYQRAIFQAWRAAITHPDPKSPTCGRDAKTCEGVSLLMRWSDQLKCTPIGKAVPADSAPATAWKACATVIAPALAAVSATMQKVDSMLPASWKDPQLCFLPKPHKQPSTATALRSIGLLRPDGKAYAGFVKNLLLEQAGPSLAQTPQYAYLPMRDTTDALARVHTCVQAIKAELRALGGDRFTIRQRKESGHVTKEAGSYGAAPF
ncbi:unnamed protein product [Symbiodinium sp. CCMP2592]|nr:unnamed protein product [Symbiodinium sp. CCMP2592]